MFSKPGTYKAVGMFSTTHIISIFACLFLIVLAVVLTRNMKKQTYFTMLKVFSVVLTCLELFKIIWSIANGQTGLNAWMPLYFCSLFIYSLWLTWFKNKEIRDFGLSFIAMAGVIAGLAFIIFPTTSFNNYPIWHFQCLYSMLYHSTFVYSSIMLFRTKAVEINYKLSLKYIIFCLIFMILAIIINVNFNSNLMFLNNPSVIPIPILRTIYNFSHLLYTTIIMVVYMLMALVTGVYKIFSHSYKHKKLA